MSALEQRGRETLERGWTLGERDGVSLAYTHPSPDPASVPVGLGLVARGDCLASVST